jgi:hypothetical protein
MVHRPGCGASGAVPGLSLGIGQRSVAEGFAGHGLTPKRYVTERDGGFGRDYGRSGAMFEAPALVTGLDDFAVGGSGDRAIRWSYRVKPTIARSSVGRLITVAQTKRLNSKALRTVSMAGCI